MIIEEKVINAEFKKDVIEGLQKFPKRLHSKYFYDEKGDKLFQEIMRMEEYYLTRSEFEIFSTQKDSIIDALNIENEKIQLIEFGAGDGLKTKILLQTLLDRGVDFEYLPIDISSSVLQELEYSLKEQMPSLKVKTIEDTYFSALKNLDSDHKKVVLFLGSNIGNFSREEAVEFLSTANQYLNRGDHFLLGVDLKKQPDIILAAYDDKRGITKAFNINLLERINRELDANFNLDQFEHYPTYDPINGETKSYLISLKDQCVELKAVNETIYFKSAEPIFMEISKKYSISDLETLSLETDFMIEQHFYDCKHYFVDTLWKKR